MTILKTLKHKYCLSLSTCHKYAVQFTDPTPTTFWYAKRAKLTLCQYYIQSSKNSVRGHKQWSIIYRPDLHNSPASKKKLKIVANS